MYNTAVYLVTLQGVGPEEQGSTNNMILTHYLLIISNPPKAGLFKTYGISCGVQSLGIAIAKILKTNKEVVLET